MQLGSFTKDPKTGDFVGSIRTLTSNVEKVRIVARPPKTAETSKDAPDYDVLGPTGSDFGAGWTQKRASDNIEYISLRLYDPSFNNGQALRPALWPRKDGGFVMIHEPLEPNATANSDPAPVRPADQNGGTQRRPAAAKETPAPSKPV
jgi:uncharacterized protein (DUF736 family)